MSLTVGSFSSGSSGPSPVISSRISRTNSSSSLELMARRSATTYCVTICWIWVCTSSGGSFSIADRLSSSIRRLCSRTLASSNLSLCNGLLWTGAGAAGTASACTRCGAVSTSAAAMSAMAGASCGDATRRAVNRPDMSFPSLARWRQHQFAEQRHARHGAAFAAGLRQQLLLQLLRDLVAWLDLLEGHAAVDRLAHQRIIVRDRGGKTVAQHLFEVGAAQARPEHFLVEAIDQHLRLRAVTESRL